MSWAFTGHAFGIDRDESRSGQMVLIQGARGLIAKYRELRAAGVGVIDAKRWVNWWWSVQ